MEKVKTEGRRLEHERRTVSVMHVEIDDGDALETARLEIANRHGDVVERTESFAMIRERVVKPAAEMTNDAEP